ncbi:acyltransferase [Cryobacterium adonitolivorans]|uniref:Acyltransferase n=1 Tax=Cryobacterium adonitolivorans TaxID=1259189 RepID=A0A4R8W0R6_9MICO|nr:acyltransferase [Cryobacterium adonitolivorans]TFB96807.1 acyltransferase [Cryobacterium adonitolivorans]
MTSPVAPTIGDEATASAGRSSSFGGRLASLDGLRGVAALVVLGFHVSLLSPLVATYMIDKGPAPAPFTALWWAVASPLRLLTAGDEAVFVFFVLSGVVLTLPVIRQRRFDWLGFMSARVLRLFLPVAASLLLATAITRIWTRAPDPSLSSWLAPPYNPLSIAPGQLLANLDLVFSDMTVNGPTWTIRWEMLFSLLLPIILGLFIAFRRRWQLGLVAIVGLIVVGLNFGVSSLVFLPIFAIGIIIALRLDELSDGYAYGIAARPRRTRLLVALLVLVALLLLGSTVVIRPYVDPSGFIAVASRVATIFGAGLLVAVIAVVWPARGWLTRALAQWLGKISFSLYLVHQPILATFGFAFGGTNWGMAALLGTISAFAVAYVFWRFIESPCHRLARVFGQWVTDSVSKLATDGQGHSELVPKQ